MSDAFEIVELSPHVRAAIGANGASNAAFIQTADGVIVVDSLSSIAAASALRDEVLDSGQSVIAVVLTHHHADHWAGLDVWGDVPVLAHTNAVKILQAVSVEYGVRTGEVLPFPALLRLWVGRAAADLLGVDSTNGIVTRLKSLAAREPVRLPAVRPIDPGTLLADGPVRVRIESLGEGHGDDDLVVSVSDVGQDVLILGDQAFFDRVPVVGGPYLDAWIDLLDGITASGSAAILLPGHGRPGRSTAPRRQAAYLRAIRDQSASVLPDDWDDERSRNWHDVNRALLRAYKQEESRTVDESRAETTE
ncbi:MBL fold metallo-hydrolase [Compostimonas suwonensis]|uniref:Glyoxylase-like metal-dependent hydrolase (Beta-lactamase superfamily II) n=1 Tax=Compostimonas suwonensis TaxID=1048394 RepID=A0A2M9C4C4_9MICO|nr:MBL fold metallo-hydrolase [Compostimonas suwonensis]PJJ65362.1 glyoxylase-like metal-dependent hydrolase (beta-lactamase superfamily II) [Compostimonas suwonensis]